MWAGPGAAQGLLRLHDRRAANLGQVWEYDPGRETHHPHLRVERLGPLENPDNVVIVPQTGDIFLLRGLGRRAVRPRRHAGRRDLRLRQVGANETEFCGACFDPDGQTLYLNQQGDRGDLPRRPAGRAAVTYAIYGPFASRAGSNGRSG